MLSIFNFIPYALKIIFLFFKTLISQILTFFACVVFAFGLLFYATDTMSDINSDMLDQAGISDITLIDSDYTVTERFQREYQNISYDEYRSYAYSVVDYLESKEYTVYCEDPKLTGMEFFVTIHYIAPYNSIDDIFSDVDKTECNIYYIYNDVIHRIKIDYCDEDTVYLFITSESDSSSLFNRYEMVTSEPEIE